MNLYSLISRPNPMARTLVPYFFAAAVSTCLIPFAASPSGDGITWEEQQQLMPAAPKSPIATREGGHTRICWQEPPTPGTQITAYDPRLAFYRIYRVAKTGRRIPIGETQGLCFVDRIQRASASAYVITVITRSGHESDESEMVKASVGR